MFQLCVYTMHSTNNTIYICKYISNFVSGPMKTNGPNSWKMKQSKKSTILTFDMQSVRFGGGALAFPRPNNRFILFFAFFSRLVNSRIHFWLLITNCQLMSSPFAQNNAHYITLRKKVAIAAKYEVCHINRKEFDLTAISPLFPSRE